MGNRSLNVPEYFTNSAIRRRRLNSSRTLTTASRLVVARVKRALPYVRPEDVIIAPDCGMKYLPREVAFGKMRAMVEAAGILRKEHGGG